VPEYQVGILYRCGAFGRPALVHLQGNGVGRMGNRQCVRYQGALIKGLFNPNGLRPAGAIRRRTMVTYQETEKDQPQNLRHAVTYHFASLRKSATDQNPLMGHTNRYQNPGRSRSYWYPFVGCKFNLLSKKHGPFARSAAVRAQKGGPHQRVETYRFAITTVEP
jgi:hypothetical protein